MLREIKNEQIRLFANDLNITAAGTFVGALVPAPLALYLSPSSSLVFSARIMIEMILMLTSWTLMVLAQLVLRRLK